MEQNEPIVVEVEYKKVPVKMDFIVIEASSAA